MPAPRPLPLQSLKVLQSNQKIKICVFKNNTGFLLKFQVAQFMQLAVGELYMLGSSFGSISLLFPIRIAGVHTHSTGSWGKSLAIGLLVTAL